MNPNLIKLNQVIAQLVCEWKPSARQTIVSAHDLYYQSASHETVEGFLDHAGIFRDTTNSVGGNAFHPAWNLNHTFEALSRIPFARIEISALCLVLYDIAGKHVIMGDFTNRSFAPELSRMLISCIAMHPCPRHLQKIDELKEYYAGVVFDPYHPPGLSS